jgi:hypothetical protein
VAPRPPERQPPPRPPALPARRDRLALSGPVGAGQPFGRRTFSKHFAIVGTTGRGKSSALACILHRALERHQHAHVIVPDMDRPRLEETVSRWRGNAARKA